jgi:hypothetical protein
MNSTWLQQDGAGLYIVSVIPRYLHDLYKRESCTILGRIFIAIYLTGLNPCHCFLWGYLKDRVFQKNPHAISEMTMVIQSEI